MSDDYAKGFKDGFKIGLEEGKRHQNLNPVPSLWPTSLPEYQSKDKCPKCGITISGVMNYTCSSINCPTFYQTTSYGAVGMNDTAEYAKGANGPAGPSLEEEKDQLDRYNQVWVNGTWVSLGS